MEFSKIDRIQILQLMIDLSTLQSKLKNESIQQVKLYFAAQYELKERKLLSYVPDSELKYQLIGTGVILSS